LTKDLIQTRKFADRPKWRDVMIPCVLTLPNAILFCILGGHAMPGNVLQVLGDIGAVFAGTLGVLPILLVVAVLLKKLFYGAVLGTKLQVTSRTKKAVSLLVILLLIPTFWVFGGQAFLWLTDRPLASDVGSCLANGAYYGLAGLPGLIYAARRGIKKVVSVEAQRCAAAQAANPSEAL
jgi:hypothetical protein